VLINKQTNLKLKQQQENMAHPKPKQTGYQPGGKPKEMREDDLRHSIPAGDPILSLLDLGCPESCWSPLPRAASKGGFTVQMCGHGQARDKGLCPTPGQDLLPVAASDTCNGPEACIP